MKIEASLASKSKPTESIVYPVASAVNRCLLSALWHSRHRLGNVNEMDRRFSPHTTLLVEEFRKAYGLPNVQISQGKTLRTSSPSRLSRSDRTSTVTVQVFKLKRQ